MYVPMSRLGFYLPYFSYVFIIPHTTVFTVELSLEVTLCTPISLLEIYVYVFLFTPLLSVETFMHTLPITCVRVLPRASLIILWYVFLYMHVLLRRISTRAPDSIHACCVCYTLSICCSFQYIWSSFQCIFICFLSPVNLLHWISLSSCLHSFFSLGFALWRSSLPVPLLFW